MPLRKFPMDPARLRASRRDPRKPTGPCKSPAKSQRRMNGLRCPTLFQVRESKKESVFLRTKPVCL